MPKNKVIERNNEEKLRQVFDSISVAHHFDQGTKESYSSEEVESFSWIERTFYQYEYTRLVQLSKFNYRLEIDSCEWYVLETY